ncbi:hypothetical protein HZB94_05025 [Candidatus Falkowbacteria bacterium]|nr:hypothetical protein [Candidatus Falkowbacteria bacterium]
MSAFQGRHVKTTQCFSDEKKSDEATFTIDAFLKQFDIDNSFSAGMEKFLKNKSRAYSVGELRRAFSQYLNEKLEEILKDPE